MFSAVATDAKATSDMPMSSETRRYMMFSYIVET
jgi:hypothetical protein